MFVTYPDVLQPGLGGLRAGVRVRALALLAASGAAVSHVIPLRMFQVLKSDRRHSAVFELLMNEVPEELRAALG